MPKRKLAVVLWLSIGVAAAVDMALVATLALEHRAFVGPLLGMTAFIPGFVIAGLAWQGRLPSGCRTSVSSD